MGWPTRSLKLDGFSMSNIVASEHSMVGSGQFSGAKVRNQDIPARMHRDEKTQTKELLDCN
jgi:hypothetical protein